MKKNLNYIFTFLLCVILSCSKDDILPPAKESEKKDISFLINTKEITNKVIQDNKSDNAENQKTIQDAVAVIVTIQDASNNILYNRKRLTISSTENGYVSAPITLDVGSYTITEFIVLDAVDNAIFLSPKASSTLANNVDNTVPFSITIDLASNDEIGMEVLSSFNLDFADFGYTDLDFTSIGEFTFVIDQTNELTSVVANFLANEQFEYVIDWGDGTEELYVPISDLVHDYAEKGTYTVSVKGNIKALTSVMVNNKGLKAVNFSKLESLVRILFFETQLSSLDVSYNQSLEVLSIASGQLTTIDLSSNILLKELALPQNQLSVLDLSANLQLESLSIYSNLLTNIDLSNNLNLESLSLGNNPQLASLDITRNSKLKSLSLSNMSQLNLDNMNLSIYPELESLSLSTNGLTQLNVSNNVKLKRLYLSQNELTALDLSANTELEYLSIDYNELTSLDLSLNDKLIDLSIANNPLDTIEFPNSPVLRSVFMVHHKITDIAILENIYSQILQNAKANNLIGGILMTYNNNYTASQNMVDIANELSKDFKWVVVYQ